jgi:hypothetical protein
MVYLQTGYGVWKVVKALMDSGTKLNFISQLVVKEVSLIDSINGVT